MTGFALAAFGVEGFHAMESHSPAVARRYRPLTERLLALLGGPRLAWIAAWAAIPWLNAGANLLLESEQRSPVWEQDGVLVVLNYIALSLAIAVSLLGTARIARQLEALRTTPASTLGGGHVDVFRGMSSAAGPIAAALAAALVFGVGALVSDGATQGVLRGATWFVVGTPLLTYVWTYGSLLVGLDRLGRERLVPDEVQVDPALGLRPLGSIAATGLWMLLVWLVPVLLTGLTDVVGAVVGMAVLVVVLSTFFLSVVRLHRQMVDVKKGELELARELYAQAYAPVRRTRSLEELDRQRTLLAAADALEKRASAIHEWPFAERTPTVVITVLTSVTAMTIGRLILDPFGL